ncbi:Death domain-associated protein 6 [Armadillidium vulgare]|nr:Death domain-associated protein 6 [Armadillidium vulgare]
MSVTVIEIDSKESNVTDEDTDFEEPPRRKRIGWNYQNVFPSKAEIQVNGNHRDSKTVDKLENTSMDDIEVLEVKEGNPKSNRQRKLLFPASSSRKEIKDTIRTTVQSSIVKYLNVKFGRSVPEKQSKSNNHENKDEKVKENGHIDAKSPSDDSKENKDSTKDAKSLSDESKENKDSTKEMSDEDCRLAVKKFVDKWKSLGTFGNDERKIEKRLWKHYDACHPTFTHSRKFLNAIDRGTKNLTMDNIIGFLDRIIRSLKEYKSYPYIEKKKKLESVPEATEVAAENVKEEVLDEEQLKKQRKLHKIEKAMNLKLVLKRKFGELDALYCKTAECSVATGRPIEKKFRYQGSRYTEINKRIEAWVNKNRTLPDYVDILNLVKKVTKQNTMPMKPSAVRKLAEDIFREVIQTLKDRREKDDLYCIYAYADGNVEMDPGDIDSELGV